MSQASSDVLVTTGDHSPDQEGDHEAAAHAWADHHWLGGGAQGGDGRFHVAGLVPSHLMVTDLGQCCHELFKLFDLLDRVVLFGIQLFFKTRI